MNDKQNDSSTLAKTVIKWLPIDTAPKDGTKVLVCHEKYYTPETAYYGTYHPNAKGKEHWRAMSTRTKIYPTHWAPLPEPPSIKETAKDDI